jgi:hypothetical protein
MLPFLKIDNNSNTRGSHVKVGQRLLTIIVVSYQPRPEARPCAVVASFRRFPGEAGGYVRYIVHEPWSL